MLNKPLVLVTGASGFLASHVVRELLGAGYRVRGTARGKRLQVLCDMFKSIPEFDAVEVADIATGDFGDALQGVSAVMHTASPLFGRTTPEDTIAGALEGTLNVLRQAYSAGIRKFVMLSTWGTTLDPAVTNAFNGTHLTQLTWGEASKEDALKPSRSAVYVYLSSKILAERAAWDYARARPELDFATVLPPWVYGPYIPGYTVSGPQDIGTNSILYDLITGPPGGPLPAQTPAWYIDVRDLARVLTAVLDVPPTAPSDIEKKRYLVIGGEFLLSDAVRCITQERPELQDRLLSTKEVSRLPSGTPATYDITPTLVALNWEKFLPWEATVVDTIDSLVQAEESWC